MDTNALILSSDYARLGKDSRELARKCAAGELRRIRQGVYVAEPVWKALKPWDRYPLLILATATTLRTRNVFCLESAAALWRIPLLGAQKVVHACTDDAAGGRSKAGISRHRISASGSEICERTGLLVTSRERTVLDLGALRPFEQAVIAFDHVLKPDAVTGLPPLDRESLKAMATERYSAAAARRIITALDFADPNSGSPGESLSRAYMFLGGFSIPLLQCRVADRKGFVAYLDFEWGAEGIAGEFDGLIKYQKPEFLRGRTVSEVVIAEKRREDRVRATGRRVVRWTWAELRDAETFAAFLIAEGVPKLPLRATSPGVRARKGQPPSGAG